MSLLLVGVVVAALFDFSVVAPATLLPAIGALEGALVVALVVFVVVSVVLTTHGSGIRSEGLLGHLSQPSSPRPSKVNKQANKKHNQTKSKRQTNKKQHK